MHGGNINWEGVDIYWIALVWSFIINHYSRIWSKIQFHYGRGKRMACASMNREYQQLVTAEMVKFEKQTIAVQAFRKKPGHLRGISGIYLTSIKKNQKISICNQLDLKILGFWLIMPRSSPDTGVHENYDSVRHCCHWLTQTDRNIQLTSLYKFNVSWHMTSDFKIKLKISKESWISLDSDRSEHSSRWNQLPRGLELVNLKPAGG